MEQHDEPQDLSIPRGPPAAKPGPVSESDEEGSLVVVDMDIESQRGSPPVIHIRTPTNTPEPGPGDREPGVRLKFRVDNPADGGPAVWACVQPLDQLDTGNYEPHTS